MSLSPPFSLIAKEPMRRARRLDDRRWRRLGWMVEAWLLTWRIELALNLKVDTLQFRARQKGLLCMKNWRELINFQQQASMLLTDCVCPGTQLHVPLLYFFIFISQTFLWFIIWSINTCYCIRKKSVALMTIKYISVGIILLIDFIRFNNLIRSNSQGCFCLFSHFLLLCFLLSFGQLGVNFCKRWQGTSVPNNWKRISKYI